MSNEYLKKENKVRLVGELKSEFEYYYTLSNKTIYQEYYMNYLVIELKQKIMNIPVVIEKSKIDFKHEYEGEQVEIIGKLKRTYYLKNTCMYVQIKSMKSTQEKCCDEVIIEGVFNRKCMLRVDKNNILRLDFEITYYDMSISCVAWKRNARYIADNISVKTKLRLQGSIVTRKYCKNGQVIEVNELCVNDIQKM